MWSKEKTSLYQKAYRKSKAGSWSKYRDNAKRRGIDWLISYEEFLSFWEKSCFYCGDNSFKIGLDRIENNKPYELKNIVACCCICNLMKLDSTFESFVQKCFEIAEIHHSRQRSK